MGGGYSAKGTSYGNTQGSKTGFKEALDHISNALAVASLIPGIDTITDIVSIPVDLLRGDFVSAGLDLVGAIPFVGEIADTAKIADKTIDAVKAIDKVADASKVTKKSKTLNKIVVKESPYNLVKTHDITMSKKKYSDFLESIRKNGITEPIKYVEFKGTKYVVDGHHRLQAAKDLKIKQIPIQEVPLPYKGYKNIDDLLW